MFTKFFIEHPIFASVLSIIITLAGSVALVTLPVAQYPEITPPTVEVFAVYPGANAQTVADTVAAPIEQQVNGVEDMMYMSSRCTNDGTYTLTVTFNPGTDLNIAQVLVQNRVNLGLPVVPDLVKRRGVTVKKKSPTVLMIINLYSPDESRDNLYLSNYATIQLRDELARVKGVGDITYLGQRDYSMRIWLDPNAMAIRKISATDVTRAIEQQNVQVAAGQVAQPPAPNGQAFQYTINTLGRLLDPEQFADMILKTDNTGRIVRLKDVTSRSDLAKNGVEMEALDYGQGCTFNGKPSLALSVYQLPGSNAIETARLVSEKMKELRNRFPSGVGYQIVYDTTPFIDESVREVFKTLADAVVLVAMVMLLFLQSWRAAIIPLAAVPVAIIGTFAAMWGLGYSLNNLTLFGLVLAVGIVVDDAIVVVEAVQHHIEHGMSPKDATQQAMNDVAGPVIAVGLVLSAVFIPCVFISGIVGQFFRQFAVTIAVSTLISAFNSLTFSPALCALLLKPNTSEKSEPLPRLTFALIGAGLVYTFLQRILNHLSPELAHTIQIAPSWVYAAISGVAGASIGWALSKGLNTILAVVFSAFNKGFNAMTGGYIQIVKVVLRMSLPMLAGYGVLLFITYRVLDEAPAGFIPNQDKGYLLVNIQLPDSASLMRTEDVVKNIEKIAGSTHGVKDTVAISGQSVLLGANAPNFGTVYVMLSSFEERAKEDRTADVIAAELQAKFSEQIPKAKVNVFGAPPVDGLGAAGGFTLVVEDPMDNGATALQKATDQLMATTRVSPLVHDAFTGYRADTPWLSLEIDRTAAYLKGVSQSEITNTLQTQFGSQYVNDFNAYSRTWQVNVQADGRFRRKPEDLYQLWVVNNHGDMVPMRSFMSIKEVRGPVMIQRYNLYPSALLTVTSAPGISSGQVLSTVQDAAKKELPSSMQSEWTELALLQQQTGDTASKAFILAVVLAFLVLAAQYESWALPLAVILVVPLCLLSSGIGVRLAAQEVNIFTQIGFVVLVGLACKNAILIVEFAKQRKEAGSDNKQATLEACRLRLRPIIMTSLAFILGVVPLIVANGGRFGDAPIARDGSLRRHDRGNAFRHLPDASILLRHFVAGRPTVEAPACRGSS